MEEWLRQQRSCCALVRSEMSRQIRDIHPVLPKECTSSSPFFLPINLCPYTPRTVDASKSSRQAADGPSPSHKM